MEIKIKIEKGIPIPTKRTSKTHNEVLPLKDMEIGDSFQVEIGDKKPGNIVTGIRSSITWFINRYDKRDWKFTIRNIDCKYVRCWRIK